MPVAETYTRFVAEHRVPTSTGKTRKQGMKGSTCPPAHSSTCMFQPTGGGGGGLGG